MIKDYFKWRQTLNLVLSTPAGPYLSQFTAELARDGFSYWVLRNQVAGAAHYSDWCGRTGLSIDRLHEDGLEGFRKHLRACRCPRPFRRSWHQDVQTISGVRAFVQYLRRKGVVTSPPPALKEPELPPLVASFKEWMQRERGVKDGTVRGYIPVIEDALETIGVDPSQYNAEALRAFVLDRTKGASRSRGKLIISVMRVFLRYLITQGLCRPGLDNAIPTLAMWRLSALPRYLPAADVDRIIAACSRDTPLGLRDRAIILLLARLGRRAGDIVGMQLTDIDWTQASVRVAGKSRDEMSLPLTQEVGEAVGEYLQRGRPPSTSTRLFVRMEAPWNQLKVSAVSALVHRAICRAKVDAPSHGAHVLRHSAATEMLRQGATLQQIGVVLRHRYLDTTAIYAKVDVQRLREIALPWPEVAHADPTR